MRNQAALLGTLLVAFVSSYGCGTAEPTIDATNPQTLEASLKEVSAGMTDQQKRDFMAATVTIAMHESTRPTREKGIIKGYNDAVTSNRADAFKPMHGMTAAEVISRAAEIRAQSASDEASQAARP